MKPDIWIVLRKERRSNFYKLRLVFKGRRPDGSFGSYSEKWNALRAARSLAKRLCLSCPIRVESHSGTLLEIWRT